MNIQICGSYARKQAVFIKYREKHYLIMDSLVHSLCRTRVLQTAIVINLARLTGVRFLLSAVLS